jgi:hypothetical protein
VAAEPRARPGRRPTRPAPPARRAPACTRRPSARGRPRARGAAAARRGMRPCLARPAGDRPGRRSRARRRDAARLRCVEARAIVVKESRRGRFLLDSTGGDAAQHGRALAASRRRGGGGHGVSAHAVDRSVGPGGRGALAPAPVRRAEPALRCVRPAHDAGRARARPARGSHELPPPARPARGARHPELRELLVSAAARLPAARASPRAGDRCPLPRHRSARGPTSSATASEA